MKSIVEFTLNYTDILILKSLLGGQVSTKELTENVKRLMQIYCPEQKTPGRPYFSQRLTRLQNQKIITKIPGIIKFYYINENVKSCVIMYVSGVIDLFEKTKESVKNGE